jgi:hypothetical protein
MNERYELYVLRQLVKLHNQEAEQLRFLRILRWCCDLGAWMSIGALVVLAYRGCFSALSGVLLGLATGLLAGFGFYLSSALRQWPVLRTHLNPDSIQGRIQELEKLPKQP